MSQLCFNLVEKRPAPGCLEIQVTGELDLAVADRLKKALERARAEHDRVLIDLQDCQFVDSTGIAVIVEAHKTMAKQGGRLGVHGVSGQVLRTFTITGLTENDLIFDSAEQALAGDEAG